MATRLAGHINRAFKTKHPIAWIFQHNTITQQASALQEKTEAGDLYQPIIEFKRGRKEKTPLVFVHSGLSGAETYAEFARLLQDDYPFYAIDSYNLNSGKTPYILYPN